jgi:hypothetical protein
MAGSTQRGFKAALHAAIENQPVAVAMPLEKRQVCALQGNLQTIMGRCQIRFNAHDAPL